MQILSLLCFAILAYTLTQSFGATVPDTSNFIRIPGETRARGVSTTYWLSMGSTTYYNALATCGSNGWNLVSLQTQSKQNEFNTKVVYKYQLPYNIWTSGRRVNNMWTWVDGTNAQYQNFAPTFGIGDCLAVLPLGHRYMTKWTAENCFTKYNYYVCESDEFNVFPID